MRCLNLLTREEKVLEQYQNSENLNRRINIHAYSTSSQSWMEWVYERLNLQPWETVLELGCGTGLHHMQQLHELVIAFDPRIEMPFQNLTGAFHLENARPQLTKHFTHMERQDRELCSFTSPQGCSSVGSKII